MSTVTIPRALAQQDDLVVLPRKEYEALFGFKKYREVSVTKVQKAALRRAEKHMRSGKILSYNTHRPAANAITYINALSKSFGFLKDEPELYSLSDVRKRYA